MHIHSRVSALWVGAATLIAAPRVDYRKRAPAHAVFFDKSAAFNILISVRILCVFTRERGTIVRMTLAKKLRDESYLEYRA